MKGKQALAFWLAALLMLSAFSALGEAVPPHFTARRFSTTAFFGTINTLSVYEDLSRPENNARIRQTWEEVKAILARVEQAVSVTQPESDIARFNELKYMESMDIRPETAELVSLAIRLHQQTGGYYDPTVYPLVDLWGFSPRFIRSTMPVMPYDRQMAEGVLPPPDPRYIAAFRQLVSMEGVGLTGNAESGFRLTKRTPGVWVDGVCYQAGLDLGGMAKGYATDLVMRLLREKGFQFGHFSSGTSSMGLLKTASASARESQDSRFHLEIRKPRETALPDGAYATIAIQDEALSSSGDYDHNYQLDGDIYSHLINPFTGYPVNTPSGGVQQGIATVTLTSGSAAEDDAYTTALCLMGPYRALDFYNTHLRDRDIALVLFRGDRDAFEVVSNIPPDRLTLLDPAYRLASRLGEDGGLRYTGDFFK